MPTTVTIKRHRITLDELVEILLGPTANKIGAEILLEEGDLVLCVKEGVESWKHVAPAELSGEDKPTRRKRKAKSDEEDDKPKGGPLARRAAFLCAEKLFQVWLDVKTEQAAAEIVRKRCGVTSRAELDHNEEAKIKWRDMVSEYEVWKDYG